MQEYYENNDFDEINSETVKSSKSSIKNVLDGSLLTREIVVKQFPFILFLVFLAVIYIGNRYHAEKIVRKTVALQTELKELRSEAITSSSELMYMSKQSEVVKLLKKKGINLKESVEPPKKIVIKKKSIFDK
ncbi:MAG: hypothetical protein KAT68_12570 [Bacteroidales bacterium]|nr:hypothetical protein [Bacteroidales bacterium]